MWVYKPWCPVSVPGGAQMSTPHTPFQIIQQTVERIADELVAEATRGVLVPATERKSFERRVASRRAELELHGVRVAERLRAFHGNERAFRWVERVREAME